MASLLDETTTTTASTATALSSNLHQAIYMNNMEFFDKLLAEINPETDQKWWYKFDARGKTPLHLAVLLGRREMIMKLMQKGHPVVTCWDKSGWTPIADGISYGDIDTIIKLMEYRNEEISKAVDVTLPKLIENFQDKLGDFYMEIDMEFQSWVPFLARFCPKDKFKIWKRGANVRMDHSLIGYENTKWIYADVSTLFTITEKNGPLLVMIDRGKRLKQQIYPLERLPEFESTSFSSETQQKLDIIHMMISPTMQTSIDHDKMVVRMYRSLSTNISAFFRRRSSASSSVVSGGSGDTATSSSSTSVSTPSSSNDKRRSSGSSGASAQDVIYTPEIIGKYVAQRYTINNLRIKTKLRLEHLSDKRIEELGLDTWFYDANDREDSENSKERNKVERLLRKSIEESQSKERDDQYWDNVDIRKFALPVPAPKFSADEYFDGSVQDVFVGRHPRVRDHVRPLKAKLWLSSDDVMNSDPNLVTRGEVFPWKISQLMTLLEVLDLGSGDTDHQSSILGQVKQFLELSGIEKGFPVKLEVPMFGILKAQVKFADFVVLPKEKPANGALKTASMEKAEQAFEEGWFDIPSDYAVDEVVTHLAKM